MAVSSREISIGILIFLIILMIIYIIVMFELYKQHRFIFATYTPPPPPPNSFFPLGTVTPLTQEQIDQRNEIIMRSINIGT